MIEYCSSYIKVLKALQIVFHSLMHIYMWKYKIRTDRINIKFIIMSELGMMDNGHIFFGFWKWKC